MYFQNPNQRTKGEDSQQALNNFTSINNDATLHIGHWLCPNNYFFENDSRLVCNNDKCTVY
jgi:hypothetical protein